MKSSKVFSSSFFGVMSSFLPFLAACPGGGCLTCGGICYTPVLSFLGLSASGFFSSNLWHLIQPLLIALSAVFFTVAFYSIYRKPARVNTCLVSSCQIQQTEEKKQKKYVKSFFWITLLVSIFMLLYSVFTNLSQAKVPVSTKALPEKTKHDVAIFDVDCLYWDEYSNSLNCKKRVEPIATEVYKLHDFAVKKNIPVFFTTCCSYNMPTKENMNSKEMLYIPLDSGDKKWKNSISQVQTYYIAKRAYGNPKMNYDKKATDIFKYNQNLSVLLDTLDIKSWIVFGDGFELCTVSAIDGLLAKGYKVSVIEDMIVSGAAGNEKIRNKILADYKRKGVGIIKLRDVLKM